MNVTTTTRQILRSGFSRQASAAVCSGRRLQTRQIGNKNDLGGPIGQEPIPEKPAGPEAMKRNIPLYAGVGLVAIAAYVYMTKPDQSQKIAGKAAANAQKAKEAGKEELENTKEDIVGGVQKLGGRGSGGQKGFRSE